MRFPTAIAHVELDASANRIAAIYPNCRITEIRSRLAIPGAELDNIDFVTGKTDKMFAEITCEPARLQLQFRWNSRLGEQRSFAHAPGFAQLRILIGQRHRNVSSATIATRKGGSCAPRAMLSVAPQAHYFSIEQGTARSTYTERLITHGQSLAFAHNPPATGFWRM